MAEVVTFLICAAVIALAFGIAQFIPREDCWPHRARFGEVYPPISDDEFVRRLSPEVPPEVGLKVRKVLSDCIGIEENEIYPEAGLLELMGDVPPRFAETPPIGDERE